MKHLSQYLRRPGARIVGLGLFVVVLGVLIIPHAFATRYDSDREQSTGTVALVQKLLPAKLDTEAYDRKMLAVANYASTTSTTTPRLWPTKAVYPNVGAILPFKRIVAYYGNYYSTKMGILGEFEPDVVLQKMRQEIDRWEAADPETPVVPAIEYIAVVAQDNPGKSGLYRARMPDEHIEKARSMAKQMDGIVILDVQVGLGNVRDEVAALDPYLSLPEVHLALDPEFSMKGGEKPGTVIGSYNANDINAVAEHLANLVREHNLPPKVLIIHRFTQAMVKNAEDIRPLPEVQMVMVMDGWGTPARKIGTYKSFVYPEPVQFTGFKLFYKNDLKPPSTRLLTPKELLDLTPQPLFIQYQ